MLQEECDRGFISCASLDLRIYGLTCLVDPSGIRMASRDSGTNSQPMKNVKKPTKNQPRAHIEHQMIQKMRRLLMAFGLLSAPVGAHFALMG